MSGTGPYVFILLHMRRMNSLKLWKSWILYSALLVSRISCLKADTTFPICLPENGQEGQKCYTPSNHSMGWSSCINECKFNHWELATIVDSRTYIDLLLKLLLHRGVYWIAASRNNTEWRWANGISLPTQLTQFLGDEKQGNCLSWDVRNCTKCLQAMECSGSYTCLCQSYRRGTANNRTTNNWTNTTVPFVAHHANFSSSTSYLDSVHTFLTEKTTTVASEKTSPQSKASAATVSPNVTFCRSTISRDTCYYYYDVHLTQYEAGVFCHGLGMKVSQFDNDNTTAQFVREKLSNILGGIWLGAVKLSNGWNWINGPKFTDVWTKNIISTSQEHRNETCLILVSSIQSSFSSMDCQHKFSVLCQDSSGIQKTAINSSPRIVASTVTVSSTNKLETETSPMQTSLRLEFSFLNANNESNITKTPSTIVTAPKSYGSLPSTQPGSNFSYAATAVVRTTPKPSTIKHGGFNFSTPLTKSLHTLYSTKTPTTVSDTEKKQFNETAIYTASFCIPASGGEVCYYYFEVRRNLHEAVALCRGLRMEIFHFDNNNATAQSVREQLINKTGGVWLGAAKLIDGWGWLDGQKFTDVWTKNIFSTDSHPENNSCLIFVPSIHFLGRMSCEETYSVLCQDSTGAHTRRPLSPRNEFTSVPVSTSRRVEISVSPVRTSSRTRSSVFNPNNVSDFASTLSFNLTNTESTTFMALTQFLSTIPTSSSSSSSSSSSRKSTTTPSKESKSLAVTGKYSSMEKTLIQTSSELAVSTTNSPVASELSTTVPTNIILQSVSTVQINTVNRSKLLESFTTTVVNGETTLTPITLKRHEIPKMNSSGGNVPLSTQRTNSHVKDRVSLPVTSLKAPLHGGTTQYNLSLSLAYLSTKERYNILSTESDRWFRSQQSTHFIRRSTSMSDAVPTFKHLPANTTYLPSVTMEQTSQLPADSFTSIVGGNTSYVQNISARTLSFSSGSIKNRTPPVSTPSYYDSATTTYKIVMSESNIAVSSQQDASKALIVGVSAGVGCLLLVLLIAVLIRKRMGNRNESKRKSDQSINVCLSNGAYADGYITEFNARSVENPLYGQSEL